MAPLWGSEVNRYTEHMLDERVSYIFVNPRPTGKNIPWEFVSGRKMETAVDNLNGKAKPKAKQK